MGLLHVMHLGHHAVAFGRARPVDAVHTRHGSLYGDVLVVVGLVYKEPVYAEIVEAYQVCRGVFGCRELAELFIQLFKLPPEGRCDVLPALLYPLHLIAPRLHVFYMRTL